MNEDKELIDKALKGDKKAFEMIVRRYQKPLLNYMGRMVGERELALDFTQDVFIKVYASLHTYRPQYKFSTWLFKIASNFLIDFWRKKKIQPVSLDEPLETEDSALCIQVSDPGPSVDKVYELGQVRKRIEQILEKIPAALRELFVLRHINEFSYEEIAEIKGLPVGTVKNRVFQTKELIRRKLAGRS